jgi:hypothetical protein
MENLSQGSLRVQVGTMKTEYTEQNIHNNKNTSVTVRMHEKYITYKVKQKHTKNIYRHKGNNTKAQ